MIEGIERIQILEFKKQLDSLENKALREMLIEGKVDEFLEKGYTSNEIIKLFSVVMLGEAQGNDEMIKNHQEYVELAKKVLKSR